MASVVRFKRIEDGKLEQGVAISTSDNTAGSIDLLVDSSGQVVPFPVHTYHAVEHLGSFVVPKL